MTTATAERSRAAYLAALLTRVGIWIARYGLAAVLLFIGGLKFTHAEAVGIQPLVSHSPLMSWMYSLVSVEGASHVIGTTEIIVALLIASRPFSAVASALGSLLGAVTFLTTLSFMLSTPGVWDPGFPALSGTGAFLIKDVCLLACAALTAGEALAAAANSPLR